MAKRDINSGLIAEQRRVKLLTVAGSGRIPVDGAKVVGTKAWCRAMGSLEGIVTTQAKLTGWGKPGANPAEGQKPSRGER